MKSITDEKIRKAQALVDSGESVASACSKVRLSASTFYNNRYKIPHEAPAEQDQLPVKVFPPEPAAKKTWSRQPKSTMPQCAVFIGSVGSCIEFLRELK